MIDMDLLIGPLGITLLLGVVSVLLIYWHSVRTFSYWTKLGIPTANTVPILGSLYEIHGKPFQEVETSRYKKLGRIYGHFEASKPVLSVAEPALLREILVKDFGYFHDRRVFETGDKVLDNMLSAVSGEDWKRIRSIVSPTFSTGKIKRMLSIFKDCSNTLCQNFKRAAEAGKNVDAAKLFGNFTMDVIASSAFSTKIDSLNDPENKFVQMAKRAFSGGLNWRSLLFFLAPRLMKSLEVSVFEHEAMDFFVKITHRIVEDRRKSGKKRNDFLQLLMDTADEVSEEENWDTANNGDITSNYGHEDIEQQILKNVKSKHLSMDELVAQCVIFFLAGYHTTAATLCLATYSLALNPEIQNKLRKEVDDILSEHKGEMTYEAIQSMKYLDNVISETLRMFPPLSRLERQANVDYKLGDTGITIPKDMVISVPVCGIHQDADFYPEPEKFDPDRFTPEERGNRNPYIYLPFGAGPRNCVGMRFALAEIKLCLAYVIANFVIKRCPETKVPIEFALDQFILQPKDAFVQMEIRKDSKLVK